MRKVPFIDKETARAIDAVIPTPFYVYDEAGIIKNIEKINEAFSWNKGFKEYFAVKATPNPFILKLMKEHGLGVDCSSLTELMLADAAGFSGDDIMFSSNETPEEDYVLAKKGKGFDTSFTVIPQDKQKFRNEKALPFTRDAMLKILLKAFPYDDDMSDDSDDEDEEPVVEKKSSKKYTKTDEEIPFVGSEKKKSKKQVEVIDPEDEEFTTDEMEEMLDDDDIDVDEFIEYYGAKSLKKFKSKTKKQFKKMINEYLESLEESDEDDEDDDEDDED